jgi:hypothetical protein
VDSTGCGDPQSPLRLRKLTSHSTILAVKLSQQWTSSYRASCRPSKPLSCEDHAQYQDKHRCLGSIGGVQAIFRQRLHRETSVHLASQPLETLRGAAHESCCKTRDALCEDTNISYILKSNWVLNERQAKRDNQVKRLCRRAIRSICDQVSRQYPEVTDLHEVSSKPLFQTRNPGVP